MKERWKKINFPKFENFYEVSTLGRLRNKKNKILSPRLYSNGYLRVNLTNDAGKTKKLRGVHRIVALTFIANPLNKPCVNHKDNNPLNNRVTNLEWVTHQENVAYRNAQNRQAKGEKINTAKLTADQVLKIRASHQTPKQLARHFSCSESNVRNILKRQIWRHI